MSIRCFVVMMVAGMIGATALVAQSYPDSKGRDFWFTFLPNYHNNADNLPIEPIRQLEHQLYIYVGAERPTSGTITWYDEAGRANVERFTIADPSKLHETHRYYSGYELRGFNTGGTIDISSSQCEIPANQSIHIEADDDVTVYALNQAELTSDAFLVLPTDALGDDYIVMAYTTDPKMSALGGMTANTTPSQFAVVAVEDSTEVEIVPSSATINNTTRQPMTVVLSKGQSFLVQQDPRREEFGDLTGSVVRANKPIAVFGGHQRTTLPIALGNSLGSRDCLAEQINPIRTWGKSAFLTPFAPSADELPDGNDLYRVLAAFDSTAVIVNGAQVALLGAGQFHEGALVEALDVTTSRPALVAQYKKSSSPGGQQSGSRIGDPLMMLVPPAEQFMRSYRFMNAQAYRFDGNPANPTVIDSVYKEQYLNVVIPIGPANTTPLNTNLLLDGSPVNVQWKRIGSSDFGYATLRMVDGVHTISADTTFGIYVYGYGVANSYGYIGGMAFRPLDTYPPKISDEPTCSGSDVVVTDSVLGDSRIRTIAVVPGSDTNVRYTVPSIGTPQSIVRMTVGLDNPYADGAITIEAMDDVEQPTRRSISIPGFTVGVDGRGSERIPMPRTWVLPVGRGRCDSIVLHNYGAWPQKISTLRFTSGAVVDLSAVPPVIAPGAQVTIRYCRRVDEEGERMDTLLIGDTCLVRPVVAIDVQARMDRSKPTVATATDPCSTNVTMTVTERSDADFGLENVTIMTDVLRNCTAEIRTTAADEIRYVITVTDPFEDAIYGVDAVDSAGNREVFIDTIPGFTLSFLGERGRTTTFPYPVSPVGGRHCRDVAVRNYGMRSITLDEARLDLNIRFSVPQHQFPIIVPPGEERFLTVCYEPVVAADSVNDVDTMRFRFGCNEKNISVLGGGSVVVFEGVSGCNVPLNTNVWKANQMAVSPQPAADAVVLALRNSVDEATVRIVDVTGGEIARYAYKGPSTKALSVSVGEIPDGTYVCLVDHNQGTTSAVIVIRR